MKQLLEQTALLLVAFVAALVLGWLAAYTVHHLEVVLKNILASA